ncbi:MAG: NAD-glutamate dehydrogenase, partial [Propionibacteriaceae bacterium]|nr:NAD-glutamate dehydrogenase [Propionibacteriaceae bacterium]
LTARLRQVLADVRRVGHDAAAMAERLAATGAELEADDDAEARWTGAVLAWLADGHLLVLGARDYDVADGVYRPRPGTGLGLLRDDDVAADAFAARPTGPGRTHRLVITKDSVRSTVHHAQLRDYVGVRTLDEAGHVVAERRFLGLFTAAARAESVSAIPGLVDLCRRVIALSGYEDESHGARQLKTLIETYPREDLFAHTASSLLPVLTGMADLEGSPDEIRAFVQTDQWGRSVSVLVFLPRDRYTTTAREILQDLLLEWFDGTDVTCHTWMGEAPLARLHFRVARRPGAGPVTVDLAQMEEAMARATGSWRDALIELLQDWPADQRGVEFSRAYQDDFPPEQGLHDLGLLNRLTSDDALLLEVGDAEEPGTASFRIFRRGKVSLAEVMPLLTALGVTVTAEWPYEVSLRGADLIIYEFIFAAPGVADWDEADRERFKDAFEACYRGWTDTDRLLHLVTSADSSWVEVGWLRALVQYLRQAGLPYSAGYMRQALVDNPTFARGLVAAIREKFEPDGRVSPTTPTSVTPTSPVSPTAPTTASSATPPVSPTAPTTASAPASPAVPATPTPSSPPAPPAVPGTGEGTVLDRLTAELRNVMSLDHDRILRALIAVVGAMVRTNAFAVDPRSGGQALAFKLAAGGLEVLPEPRPKHEIWVHSPTVEGVHLRFGDVARGGLRWSDRAEDFRTEILGLVKAQTVKNSVIVPVGAKGGFIARQAASPAADRARWLASGQAAYREYVRALLSVTDDIVAGEVVTPDRVVALDGPDPYLVVAADKGTATFSDLANAIALERGFWLGDAFASGGSHGFDHKAMGITARGAWESVRRHLHELGLDPDQDDFTVVGIGDMSGDVFGNAMVMSDHIKLVAAFDHRHVFVDPDPDPARSFAERRRLFGLPRSSWADYDRSLISPGGGVWPRSAKAIPVTAALRAALGLGDRAELTPDEFIHGLLQAPVDLLWNGGVGTYVKATGESHAAVGDKANDGLRVDGAQVRARAACEGGNLGWTQLGRIEYARAGGKINADFIDNSAGVDTSDHEVNIKILLADAIAAGRLTPARRDELLEAVTDDVARHVLAHNVDQNLVLADEAQTAAAEAAVHEDWIAALVEAGHVDRGLEHLPDSAAMADRIARGQGLTNPEVATVLSWTKIALADQILASDLPDDPFVADRLVAYFPARLAEEFEDLMASHRLRREIVATVAVNRFVDSQGVASCHKLTSDTGARAPDVIRAQLAARSILRVGVAETVTRRAALAADVKAALRLEFRREVERGTRWMLHNRRRPLDIQGEVERFAEPMRALLAALPDPLTEAGRADFARRLDGWRERGVPGGSEGESDLAQRAAATEFSPLLLGVVGIADETGRSLDDVARTFFAVRERFSIDKLAHQAERLPRTDRWALRARANLRDELLAAQTELTRRIVPLAPSPGAALERFLADRADAGETATLLARVGAGEAALAPLTVALRAVRSLLA